jgi:hypothetical protein
MLILFLQDAVEVKRFEEELARTKYSKVCLQLFFFPGVAVQTFARVENIVVRIRCIIIMSFRFDIAMV